MFNGCLRCVILKQTIFKKQLLTKCKGQSACLIEYFVVQAFLAGPCLCNNFWEYLTNYVLFCLLILSQVMQKLVCFLRLVFVAVFHFVLPFLRQRNILRLNFIFISFSSLILKPFKYLWFPQYFFHIFIVNHKKDSLMRL